MKRLYVFAEGQTDQTFADVVLMQHLASFRVYLNRAILVSHGRQRGIVHRGGGRNYVPMKRDIERLMSQEKGEDVFFTTMIDLYAIYPSFPRLDEAARLRNSPYARVDFLESAFAGDVGDSRFIPYIQLHEFEAYLFSDPSQFLSFFPQSEKQVRVLQAIADAHSSPELIDDGAQSAPSKRIIDQFPDYRSAKSVAGPQIAELIGVDVIRGKCPHFNSWLTRLESLGS
jgi:hypothetical protein